MPSKEAVKKKEELRQMFYEIYQIAWIGASPILREALDKYKKRFEELTQKKDKKE